MKSPYPNRKSTYRRGFSLVETIIALIIAGVAALSFASAAIYVNRQAAVNKEHLYALMLANSTAAIALASDWDRLGDPTLATTGSLESSILTGFTRAGDRFNTNTTPNYTVNVAYVGWGNVASATNSGTPNLVTASTPNRRAWVPNEWAGQAVMIYDGTAKGSMMRITGNTANQLNVTTNLTTATTAVVGWPILPNSTSRYAINNGKLVEITVSWGQPPDASGRSPDIFRTLTRSVYVPRSGAADK